MPGRRYRRLCLAEIADVRARHLACRISAKAWKIIDRDGRVPSFFADFRRAKASLDKARPPFTPPVTLVYGLLEALRMIDEEGLANVLKRHSRLATALRAGVQALGLQLYNQPEISSATVVSMRVPQGLEGGAIVQHLRERYRTVIAGARHPSQTGKVIRIGTMGIVSETDIVTDLRHLEATLNDLGRPVSGPAFRGTRGARRLRRQPLSSVPRH